MVKMMLEMIMTIQTVKQTKITITIIMMIIPLNKKEATSTIIIIIMIIIAEKNEPARAKMTLIFQLMQRNLSLLIMRWVLDWKLSLRGRNVVISVLREHRKKQEAVCLEADIHSDWVGEGP